jgi:hypothetical protein
MPIFESPDKGETVYVREEGSIDRVLISQTPKSRETYKEIQELKLWGNIHHAAKTNAALQEALDRVKVTYYLTKDHGNRKT